MQLHCNEVKYLYKASYKSSYEVWEPMHELHIQRLLVVTERRA